MTSIGETLRRERLRRGWELDKVSNETKISRRLLEAIETNQFDRLPGGVIAKNFVRQYAQILGLDDDEMAAELKEQFDEPEPVAVTPEPERPQVWLPHVSLKDFRERLRVSPSTSAFLWLVGIVVACAGVYGLWQNHGRPATNSPRIAGVPQPAQPRVAQTASLSKSTAAEPPKSDFRPAEVSESGTIHVPATSAQPARIEKAADSGPKVAPPVARSAVRVSLTATETVWVSVKADGNRVYIGTLAPRETRQFEASHKLFVMLGNAGGIEMTLNGKPVGPFGSPGEIQWVQLTSQGAHVVPRTPPAPPPTSEGSTAPATAAAIRP
jgi:cytoskeleton protein RodZ